MKRGSPLNRRIDHWAGIPALWLLSRLRHQRQIPAAGTVTKVGVMTSTTIGDTVLASTAVQQIHGLWPGAELVFFAAKGNRGAAAMLPGIDRIVTVSLTRPGKAIAAMRREKLDVMVDMTGWQRITALLAAASGARFVAGFSRARQHRHPAFDLAVEHRGDRHETENFAAMAAALATACHMPLVDITSRLRDEVVNAPLAPEWQNAIVFHCWATGANRRLREWPAERWAALATALRDRLPNSAVVLTAGPEDRGQAAALATQLHAQVFPSGSLASVVPLLRHARLVVSVNTGTMHLAALAGAPVIGLNGPNADRRWGPRGANAIGIDAPGTGCGYLDLGWEWERDPSVRNFPNCMDLISVSYVMDIYMQSSSTTVTEIGPL